MQKLLGFFLLLSILVLGTTNWIQNAQAQEPVEKEKPELQIPGPQPSRNPRQVDSSGWTDPDNPLNVQIPGFEKINDFENSDIYLVLSDMEYSKFFSGTQFTNFLRENQIKITMSPEMTEYVNSGTNCDNLSALCTHSFFAFQTLVRGLKNVNVIFAAALTGGGTQDKWFIDLVTKTQTANPNAVFVIAEPVQFGLGKESGIPIDLYPSLEYKNFVENNERVFHIFSNGNDADGTGSVNCSLNDCSYGNVNIFTTMKNVFASCALNQSGDKVANYSNLLYADTKLFQLCSSGSGIPVLSGDFTTPTTWNGTSASTPGLARSISQILRMYEIAGKPLPTRRHVFDLMKINSKMVGVEDRPYPVPETDKFPAINQTANVLSVIAEIKNSPIALVNQKAIVANFPFELLVGFPTTSHSQISIAGCDVPVLKTSGGLVDKYSVTCANPDQQTVMADNVAVGSLAVVGYEEGRQNLVEVKQELTLDRVNYSYNLATPLQTTIASVKVSLKNNTTTTKTITLKDFWFSCDLQQVSGVAYKNLSFMWANGMRDECNSQTFSSPNLDYTNYVYFAKGNSYMISPNSEVVEIFDFEVSFNSGTTLTLPTLNFQGEVFCEFCSPTLTLSQGEPTATPMPGAARVYLPVVVRN